MPLYDRQCTACTAVFIDVWEPVHTGPVACKECGAETERAWLTRTAGVIDDSIPGGLVMEHVCPGRKVYSHSEHRRVLAEKGYRIHDEHVPRERGSDKSPFTSRWV